jgi:O-antigen ligase
VSILKASLIGILITGLVFLFPKNRERFKEAINYKDQYGFGRPQWGEQQMRPLIWSCALELVSDSPLLGVGTGDVQDQLQECYVERDYVSLLIWEPTRFNGHNQFIEITIGQGIIGFLILLASLIIPAVIAFKENNRFYLLFIILIGVSFLTESLLERQNGVVFFAFFNSLLFFNRLSDDSPLKIRS